jgi:hypothetical protein
MKTHHRIISVILGVVLSLLLTTIADTIFEAYILAAVGGFLGYEIVHLWVMHLGPTIIEDDTHEG